MRNVGYAEGWWGKGSPVVRQAHFLVVERRHSREGGCVATNCGPIVLLGFLVCEAILLYINAPYVKDLGMGFVCCVKFLQKRGACVVLLLLVATDLLPEWLLVVRNKWAACKL